MTDKFRQAVLDAQWAASDRGHKLCPWCACYEDPSGMHETGCIVIAAHVEKFEDRYSTQEYLAAISSEREICARIVDVAVEQEKLSGEYDPHCKSQSEISAELIRARGGK